MTVGIYKIQNKINNKCYIGQSVHIERRWREHKQYCKSAIGEALKKYGAENFDFSVIKECLVTELDFLEKQYITEYNSLIPNGYNIVYGNDKPHHTSSLKAKYQAEQIIDDILYSSLTFKEIADKYKISTRTITRINQGQTYHIDALDYPLRKQKMLEQRFSICCDCGKEITLGATRCQECSHIAERKCDRPSRKELKNMIRTMSFVKIGEKYHVSDNTIRKWCEAENLPKKKQEIKSYSNEEWDMI